VCAVPALHPVCGATYITHRPALRNLESSPAFFCFGFLDEARDRKAMRPGTVGIGDRPAAVALRFALCVRGMSGPKPKKRKQNAKTDKEQKHRGMCVQAAGICVFVCPALLRQPLRCSEGEGECGARVLLAFGASCIHVPGAAKTAGLCVQAVSILQGLRAACMPIACLSQLEL
jgi:hypothetical protein